MGQELSSPGPKPGALRAAWNNQEIVGALAKLNGSLLQKGALGTSRGRDPNAAAGTSQLVQGCVLTDTVG